MTIYYTQYYESMINRYMNGEKNDRNTSEMVMLHLMKINGRLYSMLLKNIQRPSFEEYVYCYLWVNTPK